MRLKKVSFSVHPIVLATSNLSLAPRSLGKDDHEMEEASPKEENSQEMEWEKSFSSKRKMDSHHEVPGQEQESGEL